MLEAERIANDPSVKGYTGLDELFADLKACGKQSTLLSPPRNSKKTTNWQRSAASALSAAASTAKLG